MNETVGEDNCLDKYGGRKRSVCYFTKNKFSKCIGFIISAVTYGIKVNHIRGETETSVNKKGRNKSHRDISGKTDLLKVRCDIYCPHNCYYCHWNI